MQSLLTGLTDQQHLAVITRAVSVVLSAGAGCGKTHVLTTRYLSHLISDSASVSQIVAITFTEKAAREMRGRIRRNLEKFIHGIEISVRAEWDVHLQQLETAPINTIHGFCGELLRQHALTLGIDAGFDILEPALARSLRNEVVAEALQSLLIGSTAETSDLHELIVLFGWNSARTALTSLLDDVDPVAWGKWLSRTPDEIASEWTTTQRDALWPRWCQFLLDASPRIVSCLSLLKQVTPTSEKMIQNVGRLLNEMPILAKSENLAQTLEELRACAEVQGTGGAKAWGGDKEVYERVKEAFEGFRKDLDSRFGLFATEPEGVELAAEIGQRFLRVATLLEKAYDTRKRELGVVDFQDLLLRTRNLLRDHPEVRESVQERSRFILLDELQDTDPIQMEIVELLCGEIGLKHGRLFAVGDHKQSIYRFRGADVSLFESLRKNAIEDGRQELTKNFRSQPPILDFVNALCSLRMPNYEPLVPHHTRMQENPCVEFLWSFAEGDKAEAELRRQLDARSISQRIRELLESPERRIVDAESKQLRGAQPGDVVLLFRAMTNVAIYEEALRQAELDYYLVGGRAFFAQQEIYDVLNLLRAIENPEDSLSLAGVLRSPFCGLSDESLFLLSLDAKGLWQAIHRDSLMDTLPEDQRPILRRVRQNFDEWVILKDRVSISSLLGDILQRTGYDAALQFEFLGERKLANLWKLREIAREYDASGRFTLADFIARLDELVREQPREEQAATQPENANVIKLMSIHQAKGLEFPIVFVVDFARDETADRHPVARWHRQFGCLANPPEEAKENLFSDFGWELGKSWDMIADWQESLRVLYVACTRARDLLILSAGLKEAFPTGEAENVPLALKNPNAWMMALGERFHLASGKCLNESIPLVAQPEVKVNLKFETSSTDSPVRKPPSKRAELPTLPPWQPLPNTPDWPRLVTLFSLQARDDTEESLLAEAFDRFPTARERIYFEHRIPLARREYLFRRVLEGWDFRDHEGWKDVLRSHIDERYDSAEAMGEFNTLGDLLAVFADSELRRELLAAKVLHRDVEFRLDGPTIVESESVLMPFKDTPPHLHGLIDFVWQNDRGEWHLLQLSRGISERGESWECKPILAVMMHALRQELGHKLKSARQFDLSEGKIETLEMRSVKFSPALRWVYQRVLALANREIST